MLSLHTWVHEIREVGQSGFTGSFVSDNRNVMRAREAPSLFADRCVGFIVLDQITRYNFFAQWFA